MKQHIVNLILFFLLCLPVVYDVSAAGKPKAKNSCTVHRGKFTRSDLLEIHYGVKAGQNIATIKSKKGSSQDIITGFMGGAGVQFHWPNGFALQPELLYSRKGCIFQGTGIKYDIDYIELPVNFMYRLQFSHVQPFAMLSAYGGYAIKSSENGDLTNDNTYLDLIKKWDYGIGVGAGFDVWKIQLSFKYSWGLTKIIDNDDNIKNKVFTIAAGIFF